MTKAIKQAIRIENYKCSVQYKWRNTLRKVKR